MKKNHLKPDQILLYLLNELSPGKRKAVDHHLSTCQICKTLLEREGEFIHQLRNQPHQEPEYGILTRCRERLDDRLREQVNIKNQKKPWFNIGEIFTIRIPIKQLAAATIIFLLGLVFGRFLPDPGIDQNGSSADALSALQSSMLVSNFQIIPSPDKSNHVEIRFHALQAKSLQGELNDPDIQYVLSYALVNEPRDNIRLKTVGLLKESVIDENVYQALIHALEKDKNPGVRLKAIKLLKALPINEKVKEILISTLFQDTNPGVRIEAANVLSQVGDPNIRPILQKKASEDEYISTLVTKTDDENRVSISRER